MGLIRDIVSGRSHHLYPENLIGRSPTCTLRLSDRLVSGQHAAIRWTGAGWSVKDLSSRNGTFVDGVRINPGEESVTRLNARIAFGKEEEGWELVDESPPVAMAVPLDGGDPVLIDGDLLALPSSQQPWATIYRDAEGSWILEGPDGAAAPILNMQTLEIAGRLWTFTFPEDVRSTVMPDAEAELDDVHLHYSVSRDEEHVQLEMRFGGRTHDLGARSRHYLLLTLARRRLADLDEGMADASSGWVYQDDLEHDPSMAAQRLNVDVFRIRQQFAEAGVLDAARIIERRPRSRQLRIGTRSLTIVSV
jgi:hypothetical protein